MNRFFTKATRNTISKSYLPGLALCFLCFSAISQECTNSELTSIESSLSNFDLFEGYSIRTDVKPSYIIGNFLGTSAIDAIILLKNEADRGAIGIIEAGTEDKAHLLGDENDPFQIDDYSWVGEFRKIDAYEILWSNYTNDFRSFDEVPENEKVRVPYDSFFIHVREACGGGFVYWEDGKFNWLQQE